MASIRRGSIMGSGYTGEISPYVTLCYNNLFFPCICLASKGIDSSFLIVNEPCSQKEVHRCCQGDAMHQPQVQSMDLWTVNFISSMFLLGVTLSLSKCSLLTIYILIFYFMGPDEFV